MPNVIKGMAGEQFPFYRGREAFFCGLIDIFISVCVAELETVATESLELIDCTDVSELAELLEKECRLGCIGGKNGELLASEPDFGRSDEVVALVDEESGDLGHGVSPLMTGLR